MKSGGNGDNISTPSSGAFRLFHFKSEIAKIWLHKPKFQLPKLGEVSSPSEDDGSDEENEPPNKTKDMWEVI